jgi:hypothetical protein
MRVIGGFGFLIGFITGVDTVSMWMGSRRIEFRDIPIALLSIALLFGGTALIRRSKPNG